MKKQRNSSKNISKDEMTPFMRKVFAAVAKIPKGQMMTYAGVARKIGAPGAARRWHRTLKKL